MYSVLLLQIVFNASQNEELAALKLKSKEGRFYCSKEKAMIMKTDKYHDRLCEDAVAEVADQKWGCSKYF